LAAVQVGAPTVGPAAAEEMAGVVAEHLPAETVAASPPESLGMGSLA